MALGPLPDVQNVARVKALGLYQTHPIAILFFWHYNGNPPLTGDLNALLTGFDQALTTNMAPMLSTTVTITNWEAWDLASRAGATGAIPSTFVGTKIGATLPSSACYVTSWEVNYRWRGGHPRTYWPALIQTDLTNGSTVSTTVHTAMQNAVNGFRTAVNAITIGGTGGHLTAVRYIHSPVKGQPPVYFEPPLDLPIIGNLHHLRIDTQRRRLGKETG